MTLHRCSSLAVLLGLLCGCTGEPETKEARQPEIVAAASHRDLQAFFAARNYAWDSISDGVPPFILETLPADLHKVPQISEKKELFFLSLLPMVLLANEEVSSQRTLFETLLNDRRTGRAIDAEARRWASDLATEYGIDGDPLENARMSELLLRRLDVIPPSLVLAQAATESGFGTSRFARTRNNLFGEFSLTETAEGQRYRLRTFPTLYASVQAYMKNLNTHPAYAAFRTRRADLRRQGKPPTGDELAQEIIAYSERGEDYIRDIRMMMRQNQLSLLASVNLRAEDAREGKDNNRSDAGSASLPSASSTKP